MCGSPLVSYTPSAQTATIRAMAQFSWKIYPAPHGGQPDVEQFGSIVANPARQMSANYAIESSGRIGLFCEEKNRPSCGAAAAGRMTFVPLPPKLLNDKWWRTLNLARFDKALAALD